jgi:hypothetical protein|tara:strand:- start:129 stop:566 length:438 start_codon:yes stop_codon:yes gene_type:complete
MKDPKKDRTKNIFDWLSHITLYKSPSEEFTDNDWENFNSYMVHRFMSMHEYYVEIADYAQSLMPNNKKEIYNFYKEMIPKRKVWSPYIKSKTKQPNKELVEYISSYFEVGSREALSYISIMNKNEITQTLRKMGLEDKEIKKLFK